MRQTSMALLLCWLTIGTGWSSLAEAVSLKAQARDLATASTQRQALTRLRHLADPSVKGLLQALQQGALYRWQETLFIFSDEGVFVDLDGKPLLDSAGAPLFPDEGMESVPLEEDNSALVQRALDAIELFAADPAKRQSTALRLGNMRDASVLPLLLKAQGQETDVGVLVVITEALSKLRLFDPDPHVRYQAVRYFSSTRALSALSRLKDL